MEKEKHTYVQVVSSNQVVCGHRQGDRAVERNSRCHDCRNDCVKVVKLKKQRMDVRK